MNTLGLLENRYSAYIDDMPQQKSEEEYQGSSCFFMEESVYLTEKGKIGEKINQFALIYIKLLRHIRVWWYTDNQLGYKIGADGCTQNEPTAIPFQ